VLIISSPRFADHVTPPGHPERPERAEVMEVVASRCAAAGGEVLAPRPATREELERVHDARYVDAVEATRGRAVSLDPDTYTSPDSYDIALLAAGAAAQAVGLALDRDDAVLALVRPPGHHAERDRAMGFCVFNNVAVAAAAALGRGLTRVAIVDYDVHHGNGTQWTFYDDPRVLYVSTHQFPYYPGTGAADETGLREGTGFTVNVPLEAGATDQDYALVFRRAILPVLAAFRPDILLISAGFDAHEQDPLAGMRVTTAGYAAMTRALYETAATQCGGRLVAVTEGGYHLKALASCLEAAIGALRGSADPWPEDGGTRCGEAALRDVLAAQKQHWPTL
jgi:acetoin utilization deacetylase AcuC-like enzyme